MKDMVATLREHRLESKGLYLRLVRGLEILKGTREGKSGEIKQAIKPL